MPLAPGQTLSFYDILAPLGAGAMGEVWRARDTRLGREVAIKVLPDHFADDEERLRRFEREARSVAALNHPNVAQIFGVDQLEDTCFLVLELVPGETLEERLARGPLPLADALDVAAQIAAGLEAAHEAGVIHRDLKPANVRLTPDGKVKLLDFGLAKPTGPERGEGSTSDSVLSTEEGRLLGTPTYMAPEQARGRPIDRRVDLWAFGCVLFECLCARRAFAGETLTDVLATVLEREPDWSALPPGTPRHVRALLERCLAKDPRARLRDAGDAGLLLAAADGEAPAPATDRGTRLPVALAVLVLLLPLAWWIGRLAQPTAVASEPPRITQLTFSAEDHQPHVSPDGRLVAFTSSRTGISRIWLRQLEAGGEQPLTEGPDWRPRFTPDGTSVTFIRSLGGTYAAFRVPVVGGQPRKVIDEVTEVDWSPDGTRLAFVRGAAVADVELGSIIGILDVERGEERILHELSGWDLIGLGWSPDGSRLCVTKSAIQGGGGGWELLLIDVESGAIDRHALTDGRGLISAAAWSGPSALVLASSPTAVTATPTPNRVVLYDPRRREQRDLFWTTGLFPFRGSLNPTAQFAPVDEHRVVFDTTHYSQSLHEVDLQAGTRRKLIGGVSIDRQPCFHPDGGRVLFTSNRAGNVDLFAHELDSGELLQLTDHAGSDWDGAYTPDGRSILWGSDRGGHLEIWMADLDGSNPRQVSQDGFAAENPTLTSDGRWIVYSSGRPERQGIYKVRPDGSETTLLVAGNYVQPEVSPDARHSLFITADNARLSNSVYVVDVDTGGRTAFEVEIPYDLRSPNVTFGRGRWWPDGSAIVFVDIDAAGNTGLSIQDFDPDRDTRDTRRPLTGFRGELVHESFTISPDARRVVLSTIEQVRAIQLAEGLPTLR